jgi:protein translocase SecG subunit
MFEILLILMTAGYVILALFIVLIVLIQPGKSGGGLGGLGGGSTAGSAISETLGATQAEKSLAKWTMYAGAAFGILALALTLLGSIEQRSMLDLGESVPAVSVGPTPSDAPSSAPAPSDAAPSDAAPSDAAPSEPAAPAVE